MEDRWTKRVRLLGEDLVLFKDRSGDFGLIAERCPHRRASLLLRHPAAGRDSLPVSRLEVRRAAGRASSSPTSPTAARSKTRCATAGYPVEERGGLLWAYLGPLPAPRVPPLRRPGSPQGTIRLLGQRRDPVQLAADHGELASTRCTPSGCTATCSSSCSRQRGLHDQLHAQASQDRLRRVRVRHHQAPRRRRPHRGRRRLEDRPSGGLPEHRCWSAARRHACHMRYQIRVPMDDTHTLHYWYHVITPPAGADVPAALLERVRYLRGAVPRRARRVHARARSTLKTSWRGSRRGRSRTARARRSARPTAA